MNSYRLQIPIQSRRSRSFRVCISVLGQCLEWIPQLEIAEQEAL